MQQQQQKLDVFNSSIALGIFTSYIEEIFESIPFTYLIPVGLGDILDLKDTPKVLVVTSKHKQLLPVLKAKHVQPTL